MTPPLSSPVHESRPSLLTPSGLLSAPSISRRLRAFLDRLAATVVGVGGIATIVSVLGIFVFLLVEVVPLFYSPTVVENASIPAGMPALDAQTLEIGIDQYQEVAYLIHGDQVRFYRLPSGAPLSLEQPWHSPVGEVTAVARSQGRGHAFALGTRDGTVQPLHISLNPTFQNDRRTVIPRVESRESFRASPEGSAILHLAYQALDNGQATAAVTESGSLWFTKITESEGLSLGGEETETTQVKVFDWDPNQTSGLLLDGMGETLWLATRDGRMFQWELMDPEAPRMVSTYDAVTHPGDFVTAMRYLIGDRTLILGTQSGTVSAWMPMRRKAGKPGFVYEPVRTFASHGAPVTTISPSQRDKGFLTGSEAGELFLHHSTSGQTLLRLALGTAPLQALMFAPKANGAVAFGADGAVHTLGIDNPHPEITFNTLFRPVLYEGYDQPEHIWQSSSGSDDFEPKFGLIPLIFGTLKGTIYAMLLAVPLAVMGAIYTGMFMSPGLRSIVKPVLEIMAALPSVVLGFLAGLWLAPLLERIFPAVLAMAAVLPLSITAACIAWQFLPATVRWKKTAGIDLAVLLIVLSAAVLGCLAANQQIESLLFDSDYKQWLRDVLGSQYDQRNAMVISFAMGFAVIPIIFSISEDSISNVPKHLVAGSLAMGATPWQTLTRLVLVSASPGIFSALMIGFGRAVGETMIVLMATGNTPILEWSIFNGFRTLSANIAVEMPEAPHGGTLYRVLFLSGLLLFAFTFFINTIAEIIRQRLRAKYSQY